jgi:hypothetical protein
MTKGQTMIYKTLDRVSRTQLILGDELGCSGMVSSTCSTSGLPILPWYWLSKFVYILSFVIFTSSECKDNIRVTNKLLSGYHHGRGNIKPASKYLTLRTLQFLNHVIIIKTKVLLTQVYGTLANFIYPV